MYTSSRSPLASRTASPIRRNSRVLCRARLHAGRGLRFLAGIGCLVFASTAQAQVRITEYMYSGPDGEFVELTNVGGSPVDMTGWSYDDNSDTPGSFSLSEFGTVAPGESVIITESDAETFRTAWGLAGSVGILGGSGGVAAIGRNDAINLWDSSNTLVDRLQYGDQDFPGTIRTQDVSGWVCTQGLGDNDAFKWTLAAAADAQGSFTSTGGAVGSPGTHVLIDCPSGACCDDGVCTDAVFGHDCTAGGGTYVGDGTDCVGQPCPDAPLILSVSPPALMAVASLPTVTITFDDAVAGVAAADLTVNGSPATAVTGSGAGPYEFSGYAAPSAGSVGISLGAGAIVSDPGSVPFVGASWTVAVGTVIVINELNYHPHDTLDPDQFSEFLELYNAGSTMVDLSGWTTTGVVSTIPASTELAPGAYLVLAINPAELETRTGYAGAIAWTSGNLSNGGETVTLTDAVGNLIDSVSYSDGGQWPGAPDGDGPSLELINPGLPNELPAAWQASVADYGTPGQVNSVYVAAPAPLLQDPMHTPSIPAPGSPVTITVSATDDGPTPPTVTLHYRVDAHPAGSYASALMYDDGAHGDGGAGDGRFGVELPGLADGEQYDFYITADDGTAISTVPANHPSANPACSAVGCLEDPGCTQCQTMLCKFSSETLPTDFPVMHILVPLSTKVYQESLTCNISSNVFDPCKTEFDATFIDHQGAVYYNVLERYRGQSSISLLPRSYAVDFASDNPMPSPVGFPVTRLILNSNHAVRQKIGFDVFGSVGLATSRCEFVRLRYTGINYDNTHIGSNGFIGLYACIERVDDDFLESQNGAVLPDRGLSDQGNLYRGENSANFDWRGTLPDPYRTNFWGRNGYSKENNEQLDDWTDLITLLDAMNNSSPETYGAAVAGVMNEDACLRYFAMHMILGNKEGGIYRETGDDYFLYMNPPGHPDGYDARFITWDTDSILLNSNTETIWRTGNTSETIATIRDFLRSNEFAPIFVKDISDLINVGPMTINDFNARIDAMPDAAFFTSGGSSSTPRTRAQFKAWYATRVSFINNEIIDNLTLTGVPNSPYTSANPVITLSGQLNQAGTHNVTLNDQPVTYSVYAGTWSKNVSLVPGLNRFTVRSFDRQGVEMQSISASVMYDPPALTPGLRLTIPNRMVDSKTLTLKAEILDAFGRIDSRTCSAVGTVSAQRLSDGTPVPISVTVFETFAGGAGSGGPAPDSIRFYNGVGTVSITLDDGAAAAPGDIVVTVTVGSHVQQRIVEVLDGDNPALYRVLSGPLSGPDLTWGPADGVIHLTGTVTLGSGELTIQPGTLIMVDPGPAMDGTAIFLTVTATLDASGTRTEPIFFFPTAGPPAMSLPQTVHNNPSSWRGIYHTSHGTSTYRHVFLTGAGNGIVSTHPRPPILRFQNSHSMLMEDCLIADSPGMGIAALSGASGTYTIRRSVFNRLGIGGEWLGSGCTLLVEDSWFSRIGWALEAYNVDGDILHVDRPNNSYTIRRSVLTDCGDDLIDHSKGAQPVIEDSLLYDTRDKIVSIGPLSEGPQATLTMINCLVFDGPGGIRCNGAPAYLTNCTIGRNTNVNGKACTSIISKSILWTNSTTTCCGTVDHTIIGNTGDLGCGLDNLSANPMFTSNSCDYRPQAGSPALTAGPGGTKVGWLGFPSADSCLQSSECTDSNPCTDDFCDPAGLCAATPNTAACDDGDPCTDGDVCASGSCAGEEIPGCFVCTLPTECDDGLECTDDDCVSGFCEFLPKTSGTPCADDGNFCTDNACDGEGACIATGNSSPCDDGDPCTEEDVCGSGLCAGAPIPDCVACELPTDCDDGLECTDDDCVADVCVFTPAEAGTLCTDDGNPCTVDVCDGAGACIALNNEAACDDGLFCNGADTCSGGTCSVHTGDPCIGGMECAAVCNEDLDHCFDPAGTPCTPDADDCTDNVCDGAGACVIEFNAAPCDDGNACTDNDICADGLCAGIPIPGCVLCDVAADCDDGLECTSDDCDGEVCVFTPLASGEPCTDDGNVCTDNACDGAGACVATPNSSPCDDSDPCTEDDLCADSVCAGTLVPGCIPCDVPADCDDGLECTTEDCVAGRCQITPLASGEPCTDDGNVCTDNACDGAGACAATNNTTACDDDDACTENDMCADGVCAGTVVPGCVPCDLPIDCDDGLECTSEDCVAGRCEIAPLALGEPCTDDGNVCTDNACDGAGACVGTPNSAACDDGLFCNGSDTCDGGTCSIHTGDPCVGGDECADACDEEADHCLDPAGTACTDDGNPCTADECNGAGVCVSQETPAVCDDEDACTIDSCTPETGCSHQPVVCDDGNICTDDACDSEAGCAYTPNSCSGACCIDDVCTELPYPDCHPFICDASLYVLAGKPICFGDADGNGVVNAADRGTISANIDMTDPVLVCRFDLDGNGVINAADRGVVSANIGLCVALPDYQNGSGLNSGVPDTRFGTAIFKGVDTTCEPETCP